MSESIDPRGTQTPTYGLRYPVPADPADVPADMQRLATDVDTQLGLKQATSQRGQANGYASLDATGRVPAAQLPPAAPGFQNPMTAMGDLIQGLTGGAAARLAKGPAGSKLMAASASPIWQPENASVWNPAGYTTVNDFTGVRHQTGQGPVIAIQGSGFVLCLLTAQVSGRPGTWVLRYGTGGVPAAGSAEQGQQASNVQPVFNTTLVGFVGGLSVGVTYWFDVAIADDGDGGGGTTTIAGTRYAIFEL